jgi:hypothetical protein
VTTTVAPTTSPPTTTPPETDPGPVATISTGTEPPATAAPTTAPPPADTHNCNQNPAWCSPYKGTVGGNCSGLQGKYGNAPDGSQIICVSGPNATYIWAPAST